VVAYDPVFLDRAADELGMLPTGSAIEQMLGDYAVMRVQGRAAAERRPPGCIVRRCGSTNP
jgi:hypothetical protein